MRRRSFVLIVATSLIVGGVIFYWKFAERDEQKRRLEYQRITQHYSDVLKPGMTRAEVENLLRSRKQAFTRFCCVGKRQTPYADEVKLGEGTRKGQWPCTATNIYIDLEFEATEPHSETEARDSDRLLRVIPGEGMQPCL